MSAPRRPRLTPNAFKVMESLSFNPHLGTARALHAELKLDAPVADVLARLVKVGYAEQDEHEPDFYHLTDEGELRLEKEVERAEAKAQREEERLMREEEREFAAYERELERDTRSLERAVKATQRKPPPRRRASGKRTRRRKKSGGGCLVLVLILAVFLIWASSR